METMILLGPHKKIRRHQSWLHYCDIPLVAKNHHCLMHNFQSQVAGSLMPIADFHPINVKYPSMSPVSSHQSHAKPGHIVCSIIIFYVDMELLASASRTEAIELWKDKPIDKPNDHPTGAIFVAVSIAKGYFGVNIFCAINQHALQNFDIE
jgi:hypothetical protein